MTDRKTPSTYVAENGITFGVIALALLVVFGVGLPRWIHDDGSTVSNEKITLPSSLSGGYVSAESAASWKDAISKKQIDQQNATSLQQQAVQLSKQVQKNVATLGAGAAARMYVDAAHGSLMVVSAVRERSAFMVGLTSQLQKVGHSLCTGGGTSSSGSVVYCSRTSDDLTVEVQVQGGTPTAASAAKHIDEVWDKVS